MSSRCKSAYVFNQKGAAILLLLLLVVIGAATFFVATQDTKRAEEKALLADYERLKLAKQALIAYAAFENEPQVPPPERNRPGELPCPDNDNDGDSGFGDGAGNSCLSYVGWLPFKTLQIDELRDSAGHRLWYGISNDYQTFKASALNSTVPGTLSLDGKTVVAVVIAPGGPINSGQKAGRPVVEVAGVNAEDYVDFYLDFQNADGDPTESDQTGDPDGVNASSYFNTASNDEDANDLIIAITAEEIWQRASSWSLQEVRTAIRAFHAANGNLPYAKDSAGDCTAPSAVIREGLLPVADAVGNCVDPALPASPVTLAFPTWFTENEWDTTIFYVVSPNCAPGPCVVGAGGITFNNAQYEALAIDSGAAMNNTECFGQSPYAQSDARVPPPPATNICEYLELNANTDFDFAYDSPTSTEYSNDRFLPINLF